MSADGHSATGVPMCRCLQERERTHTRPTPNKRRTRGAALLSRHGQQERLLLDTHASLERDAKLASTQRCAQRASVSRHALPEGDCHKASGDTKPRGLR